MLKILFGHFQKMVAALKVQFDKKKNNAVVVKRLSR
jgi:hypothetical protein